MREFPLSNMKIADMKKMSLLVAPTIAALLLVIPSGCSSEPVVVEREVIREVPVEVVVEKEVVKEVVVVVTATPAPQPTHTPHPTAIPQPTAVPKRVSEDYYVTIKGNTIRYWADFPSHNYYGANTGVSFALIKNDDLFMDHLLKKGAVTLEQKNTHYRDGLIRVSLDDISVAIYKLLQEKGYDRLKGEFDLGRPEIDSLLYYFDESLLDAEARVQPVPTPTPRVSEDYYVTIKGQSIEYFADLPSINYYGSDRGGASSAYFEPDYFISFLLKESIITPEQKNAHSRGEGIKVDFDDLSVGIYKLLQIKGYHGMEKDLGFVGETIDQLLYYFDESLLDSSSAGYSVDSGNYVVVSDGRLETVVTDADGNTTRVKVGTVDAGEFLDYLLSQGKITVEQRNEYGDTHYLELSLRDAKDAADFFDWAYSSDEGLYIGIDKDDVNYIRDKLLPLFSFGD